MLPALPSCGSAGAGVPSGCVLLGYGVSPPGGSRGAFFRSHRCQRPSPYGLRSSHHTPRWPLPVAAQPTQSSYQALRCQQPLAQLSSLASRPQPAPLSALGGTIMAPKGVPVLIPGTCECVTLPDNTHSADAVKGLEMQGLSWVTWGPHVLTRVLTGRRGSE